MNTTNSDKRNKNHGGGGKSLLGETTNQGKVIGKKKQDINISKFTPRITQMAETLVGPAASTRNRSQGIDGQGSVISKSSTIPKMFNATKEKDKDREYKSKN